MTLEKKFIQSYDLYADSIFRYCYFRVSNREKAQDIMQDSFMRTWEYIAKGNEIENIRAFLFKIASNLIVDSYRKRGSVSLDELQEQGFEPAIEESEKIYDQIDTKTAIESIQKLEERQREVVLLRYVEEFTPKEIANMIGEDVNVVSVRIHRGMAELQKIITS